MFDFEKLEVYQVARKAVLSIADIARQIEGAENIRLRLTDLNLNILQQLVKGTGCNEKNEKKHYYAEARLHVFETVAYLQHLQDMGVLNENQIADLYMLLEQLSRMLQGMVRSHSGLYSKTEKNRNINTDDYFDMGQDSL